MPCAENLPGSVKETAASDLPFAPTHRTVALFRLAALITPCGEIQSWCVRSSRNRGPGVDATATWFQAKFPLTYWSLRCWPESG